MRGEEIGLQNQPGQGDFVLIAHARSRFILRMQEVATAQQEVASRWIWQVHVQDEQGFDETGRILI